MKNHVLTLFAASALASGMLIAGCSDDGPAEEAAEDVDEAVEEAGDAVEDAAEEAGDAVEDATDG